MTLTEKVKRELNGVNPGSNLARAAQISSILRFAGALQMISGRYVIEAELDTETLAKRLAHELAAIYGVRPRIARSAGGAASDPHTYLVRVLDQGETIARQTGLMDARGRIVRGLPNRLTLGTADVLAAIWRGAFIAAGSLTDPGRSASLEIVCANRETAMALVGAAGRLGIAAKQREVRGVNRVVIRDAEAINQTLSVMGAKHVLQEWEALRQRRETRATANRLVNFDDANLRRSAQAAVAACARVERAFEILGDQVPDHLRQAGELRLAFREASLDELGQRADPPMTKDAVAGRVRRLLALADREASQQGIPDTASSVPEGELLD